VAIQCKHLRGWHGGRHLDRDVVRLVGDPTVATTIATPNSQGRFVGKWYRRIASRYKVWLPVCAETKYFFR